MTQSNTKLLEAIAEHGSREHVMRHLDATNSMSALNAWDVAKEEDIDPEDYDTVAETFVEAWDEWFDTVYSKEERENYREDLEDKWGDEADKYC